MELHSNRNQHQLSRQSPARDELYSGNTRRSIPILGNLFRSWKESLYGNRENHNGSVRNRQHIGIYAVAASVCFASFPALAEGEQPITAIANPQATSSGSVTNQAVQVLQGPYATNAYGGGISCQGPTLNFTPFVSSTISGQWPYEPFAQLDGEGGLDRTGQKNNWAVNPGVSLTLSIPLDAQLQDQCKEAAATWNARQQAEADKSRLDFELVRLLRCGEAMKQGIYFHPDSPYAKICSDVIVPTVPRLVVESPDDGPSQVLQ